MKIVKIALPLSVLPLIGMILAVRFNDFTFPPAEAGFIGFLYLICAMVFIGVTYLPLIIFIPFGLSFLICELCLFLAKDERATAIAAIVLMSILSPVVLLTAVYAIIVLTEFMVISAIAIAACAVLYHVALALVYVGYFLERAKCKQIERANDVE